MYEGCGYIGDNLWGSRHLFFPCQKEAYSYYAFWVVRQRLLLFFLRNVEHRKSFSFLFATIEKVSVGWSLSRFYFPFPERPNGHYTCVHTHKLVQQQDARCTTTNLATWWWWWWLVGPHKYSSIIIGLYDPSFSLSLFVRSFFFLLLLLPFWNFLFLLFFFKKRKEKRETLLIFECVRVCCHSRAPASPLWIFLWTRRRAIGSIFLGVVLLSLVRSLRTSAVPTHTQEGKRRRDTRVWPLQKEKGAIQNGNDPRAEEEEEEEAQNVSTPGQVRPEGKI